MGASSFFSMFVMALIALSASQSDASPSLRRQLQDVSVVDETDPQSPSTSFVTAVTTDRCTQAALVRGECGIEDFCTYQTYLHDSDPAFQDCRGHFTTGWSYLTVHKKFCRRPTQPVLEARAGPNEDAEAVVDEDDPTLWCDQHYTEHFMKGGVPVSADEVWTMTYRNVPVGSYRLYTTYETCREDVSSSDVMFANRGYCRSSCPLLFVNGHGCSDCNVACINEGGRSIYRHSCPELGISPPILEDEAVCGDPAIENRWIRETLRRYVAELRPDINIDLNRDQDEGSTVSEPQGPEPDSVATSSPQEELSTSSPVAAPVVEELPAPEVTDELPDDPSRNEEEALPEDTTDQPVEPPVDVEEPIDSETPSETEILPSPTDEREQNEASENGIKDNGESAGKIRRVDPEVPSTDGKQLARALTITATIFFVTAGILYYLSKEDNSSDTATQPGGGSYS